MSQQTPKAFDFGDEPQPAPDPGNRPLVPRALDFGDADDTTAARQNTTPKALSFDDIPPVPETSAVTAKAAPKPLFDSEDHPAVRDALATARADYPSIFKHSEQRLAALFRRILPVRLALVTCWAEGPLMAQAALLQPVTELVLKFSQMAVPALLEEALESSRAPTGVFSKLFRRAPTPAQSKAALTSARAQLLQLMTDSEVATRNLEESATNLNLHWAALAVVSKLAGGAADATLLDALVQRRTLIQQAARQAALSILQMGQVRQQTADLIGQVSSFLTVTLPALEMAQAQSGN
ncbi:hypothetical protein CR105_20415 [Massilia eurypsychrophila]|uniref:Uncharacterized protein n=1 Tax=Massilia eurypsychrophila TaxID=1485217 RepID=A0A2G8TAT5_9BURK|nr:hypothetical protein [Massilia eurypsychrophila]PIL43160.1 hypothetical protein CR105_20415 [Massilia eurypsychrophila]